MALDQPVYRRVSNGRFRLRFRLDAKAYAPAWAIHSLRDLQRRYHETPRYVTTVGSQPGDVLDLADNFRVLHGRQAFQSSSTSAGSRSLARLDRRRRSGGARQRGWGILDALP